MSGRCGRLENISWLNEAIDGKYLLAQMRMDRLEASRMEVFHAEEVRAMRKYGEAVKVGFVKYWNSGTPYPATENQLIGLCIWQLHKNQTFDLRGLSRKDFETARMFIDILRSNSRLAKLIHESQPDALLDRLATVKETWLVPVYANIPWLNEAMKKALRDLGRAEVTAFGTRFDRSAWEAALRIKGFGDNSLAEYAAEAAAPAAVSTAVAATVSVAVAAEAPTSSTTIIQVPRDMRARAGMVYEGSLMNWGVYLQRDPQ
jgi:hypothetical protein